MLTNCDAYDNFPPRMFAFLFYGAKVPGFVLDACAADAHRRHAQAADRLRLAVQARHSRATSARAGSARCSPTRASRRDITKLLKGVKKSELIEAANRFKEFDKPVLLAWGTEKDFFDVEVRGAPGA